MARFLMTLALVVTCGSWGFCEGVTDARPSDQMELRVWGIPASMVLETDSNDREGVQKPLPGFIQIRVHQKYGGAKYDARGYLESNGVKSPNGAEAIYDKDTQALVVRNTKENLERVDDLLEAIVDPPPSNVAIEFSTYECLLPPKGSSKAKEWITYSEVMALPSTSRKLLDQVSAISKEGQRMYLEHIHTGGPELARKLESEKGEKDLKFIPFQDGQLGTKAEVEVSTEKGGMEVSVNTNFQSRVLISKNQWSAVNFITSFTCRNNIPMVIASSPVAGGEGKFIVVVADMQMVNSGGWKYLPQKEDAPVSDRKEP